MEEHSFFVGSIFEQRGHLNSDIMAEILFLFFVAGVVVVGVGVEASSEAWWHCAMCRVSHPYLQ